MDTDVITVLQNDFNDGSYRVIRKNERAVSFSFRGTESDSIWCKCDESEYLAKTPGCADDIIYKSDRVSLGAGLRVIEIFYGYDKVLRHISTYITKGDEVVKSHFYYIAPEYAYRNTSWKQINSESFAKELNTLHHF